MNQSDSTGIVQTIANNEDKAQDMKNAAQKSQSNKRSAEKAQELLRNGKSQIESSLRDAESFLLNLI